MGILNLVPLKLVEFTYVTTLCFAAYCVFTNSVWLYCAAVCVLYVCLKAVRKKSAGKIKIRGQGVFITGCDTGFGHDIARRLDDIGFTVFAGCLKPEEEGAKHLRSVSSRRLHIVPLDVGRDESMEEARLYVVKHLPPNGLWGIINNAWFNVLGDVELLTLNLYSKVFNVNFYGAVRLLRNFLYLIRQTKGRVVIVTSIRGRIPWPGDSAYHVTKHGLETLSDVLRLEMIKFGVNVSVIEPGGFSAATAYNTPPHYARYREEADEMWNAASDDVKQTYGREYLLSKIADQKAPYSAKSTRPVIDAMVDALVSGRPHTRYMVDGIGYLNYFDLNASLARYYDYLPTWFTDWILVKRTGCDIFPVETGNRLTRNKDS